MFTSKKLQSELVLLLIALIWGASFSLMRNVIDLMPEIPYLAIRFTVASIALLILFRKRLKGFSWRILLQGCIIGLTLYFGMGLQVYGLRYTTATNSAFITGLNFVFVPIISALFLKKFPSKLMVLGVFIAAVGLFCLSGGLDFHFNIGDLLTFICAVFWAFQIIFIDKFTEKSDSVLLGLSQVLTASLMFLITWAAVDRSPLDLSSPFIWFVLLWTGLGGTAFAFAAQTIVQKNTTPTHTAVIFSMEPVFGMLFALFIPNIDGSVETITLIKGIGCALMFGGMLVCELSGLRSRRLQRKSVEAEA